MEMAHDDARCSKLIIWNILYEAKQKKLTENWPFRLRHNGIKYALGHALLGFRSPKGGLVHMTLLS